MPFHPLLESTFRKSGTKHYNDVIAKMLQYFPLNLL